MRKLHIVSLAHGLPKPFTAHLLTSLNTRVVGVRPGNNSPTHTLNKLFSTLGRKGAVRGVSFHGATSVRTVGRRLGGTSIVLSDFHPKILGNVNLSTRALRTVGPGLIVISVANCNVISCDSLARS